MYHQRLALAGVLSLTLLGCMPHTLTLSPAVQDDVRTLAQTLCHPCPSYRMSQGPQVAHPTADPPTQTTRASDTPAPPSNTWDWETEAPTGPEGE
jgi:hypothetical protein